MPKNEQLLKMVHLASQNFHVILDQSSVIIDKYLNMKLSNIIFSADMILKMTQN